MGAKLLSSATTNTTGQDSEDKEEETIYPKLCPSFLLNFSVFSILFF